jgi:hypothetical protein
VSETTRWQQNIRVSLDAFILSIYIHMCVHVYVEQQRGSQRHNDDGGGKNSFVFPAAIFSQAFFWLIPS